jgi:hypothetical protein
MNGNGEQRLTVRSTAVLVIAISLLGGSLVASAQVSSGSTEAAQQNLAKRPTDRGERKTQRDGTNNSAKQTSKSGQ